MIYYRQERSDSLSTIRLLAALHVAFNHASFHLNLSGFGIDFIEHTLGFFYGIPIFFTLSGFLIWMSIGRANSFIEYAQKRLTQALQNYGWRLGTGFLSFVAGLQGVDRSQFEAGYMDGVKNRWQELWFITLPNMKPMLMFGAVMSITQAFGVCDVTMALCGYPSTDYAARTIVTHLFDYGFSRFEMGYACAIATLLFLIMILCNKAIQSLLRRVGT